MEQSGARVLQISSQGLVSLGVAITIALILPVPSWAQSSEEQVVSIAYYPNGLVSSTTLPDGSFTSYVYDAAQRLTDIIDAEGNSIHYTLDNAGNRTKEEVKGEDGTLRRTLSRVYNQLGQLRTAKDAGNHPTGFTYDVNGNLDTTTDALGRVTDNDYDPLNRLTKTIQDVGGIAATTQFRYDAQDNLTEVVDPKGLSTKYQYNAFGDMIRLESPDTGVTVYGYDSAGNRTSALDARGELSTYSYDALNRLTGISYSDVTLNVTYTYDTVQADCEAFEAFAAGRLTRMVDSSGETRYCHDRFGNLTRKVQVANGQTFTVRYAYTKAGNLAGIQYPDGAQVDYVRDGLGRTTEVGVTQPGEPRQVLLTAASYHPFGPVAGWTFGNGRVMSRTLDLDYRPRTILSTGFGASGLNLGFGWDAVGNLSTVHTSGMQQPPRIKFDYDALNRLTAFTDGPSGATIEGYTYDATGNRTRFTNASGAQVYDYPASSHRLDAVNGVPRAYDASGNTTSIGGVEREFAYNAAGRMSRVERNNVLMMEYSYNGLGEQVGRFLGTAHTHTLYDESGHWLGDFDNPLAPQQQLVWLNNLPVGLRANGVLQYIEADHLGTPRVVIDGARDVAIWTWDVASEAFGDSSANQDPDADGVPLTFNMRFPGQRADAASGLSSNYLRDGYDAGTGRYTQSDPIGLGGGISTYAYVGANPNSNVDPSGLDCIATGSRVTCTVPGGGPTVTFPRPPGWPDTISPSSNFYHFYNIAIDMEGVDPACVAREIRNKPTPGDPGPATPGGTSNNATPNGAQDAFNLVDRISSFGSDTGGYNNSPVISYQLGGSVVNVTQPGHPLHPGYVVRQTNGGVVNNYGEGVGALQSRYSPVASQINGVWEEETKRAIEKCKCK